MEIHYNYFCNIPNSGGSSESDLPEPITCSESILEPIPEPILEIRELIPDSGVDSESGIGIGTGMRITSEIGIDLGIVICSGNEIRIGSRIATRENVHCKTYHAQRFSGRKQITRTN